MNMVKLNKIAYKFIAQISLKMALGICKQSSVKFLTNQCHLKIHQAIKVVLSLAR